MIGAEGKMAKEVFKALYRMTNTLGRSWNYFFDQQTNNFSIEQKKEVVSV